MIKVIAIGFFIGGVIGWILGAIVGGIFGVDFGGDFRDIANAGSWIGGIIGAIFAGISGRKKRKKEEAISSGGEGGEAVFLIKCSCGNTDKQNDPNRIAPCSSCGGRAWPVCAACEEGIMDQDVKECKGMVVHDNKRCWDAYWDKN